MDWLSSYITSFSQHDDGHKKEPPSSRNDKDDDAPPSAKSTSGSSSPPCSSAACRIGCDGDSAGDGDTEDDSSSHAADDDEIDCEVATTTTTTTAPSSPGPSGASTSRPRQGRGDDARGVMNYDVDDDSDHDDAIHCCLHFGMAAILLTGFLAFMAVHMGSQATSSQGSDLLAVVGTVIVLAVAISLLGCVLVAAMASCSDSTALKLRCCTRQRCRRGLDPSKGQTSDEDEGMDSASTIDTGSVTSSSSSSSSTSSTTPSSTEAESVV